jgi:hypothetical protein
MRHHWNGSGLLLHEYCHLIHQHVFGLDCIRIQSIYETMKQSNKYEHVLRRDWADKCHGNDTDLAYCMIDCKEFFAEMSVTYLADSFHHLDNASFHIMIDCTPPITEPTVLLRLRHNKEWTSVYTDMDASSFSGWLQKIKTFFVEIRRTSHCNKFYPFTSGQLRRYDPILYGEIKALWFDILQWEDPNDTAKNSCNTCNWMQLRKDNIVQNDPAIIVIGKSYESHSQFVPLSDTVDL